MLSHAFLFYNILRRIVLGQKIPFATQLSRNTHVTMAKSIFAPYHGLWLDDAPTKPIGIPTPWMMTHALGFVEIFQAAWYVSCQDSSFQLTKRASHLTITFTESELTEHHSFVSLSRHKGKPTAGSPQRFSDVTTANIHQSVTALKSCLVLCRDANLTWHSERHTSS